MNRHDLPTAVHGRSVWAGRDLEADHSWIRTWSSDELDELDEAVSRCARSGLRPQEISPEQVDLPSLDPMLRELRSELTDGRGIALLRGLPMERFGEDGLAAAFWILGGRLGTPQSQNKNGDVLGHVTYQGADLSDPTARGYMTRNELRFHCDAADIVGLACVANSATGGDSLLASSMDLYNQLLDRRPELVPLLFDTWYFDRRDEQLPGEDPYLTTPIFAEHDGVLSGWFVPNGLRASQRHPEVGPLSAERAELLDLIEDTCRERALAMRFEPGDIQFVHNFTVSHARTEYEDPPDGPARHLLRLWLTIPDGRDVSAFPGGGGRAGIAAHSSK